jgi:hypothetical protein
VKSAEFLNLKREKIERFNMLLFQLFCWGYREGLLEQWSFQDHGKDSVRKEIRQLSMCKEKPKRQMMFE